ncbi:MAG: aminopeptidase [Actinobacteria bacterium]|nr:aminopeptidase [Actinomycetota bacterium]
MSDSEHRRLADVLVGYSTAVQPGDVVRIEPFGRASPLARELYASVLRAGGHPAVHLAVDEVDEIVLKEGTAAQVEWIPPDQERHLTTGDVWIVIDAPANTRRLTGVDTERMAQQLTARGPLQSRYLERSAAGQFRWLICGYATEASAQDAGMSLRQFEQVLHRAAFLDADDPVAAWKRFAERLEQAGSFLEGVSELRIVGEDTDLRMEVQGRTWIRSKGLRNFPDGEVFTGPVEESVEGTIRFSFPAMRRGRQADEVRLRFEGGEVVEATARRGEDFLREMIALDDGARRVGEFAFGMNDAVGQYTGNLLLDEKIGGTVHLALGRSVPGTGGVNQSGLHWDIVCDLRHGGEAYADGDLVYRDGRFLPGVLSS